MEGYRGKSDDSVQDLPPPKISVLEKYRDRFENRRDSYREWSEESDEASPPPRKSVLDKYKDWSLDEEE